MSKETAKTATAEEILAAAAALSGQPDTAVSKSVTTEEVDKAAPPFVKKDDEDEDKKKDDKAEVKKGEATDEDEDKKDKEIQKSFSLTEAELTTLLERAALAGATQVSGRFDTLFDEVQKGFAVLGDVRADTQATLAFQGSTTKILTEFRDLAAETAVEQAEVQKSLAAQVKEIGARPGGRKSALTDEVVKGQSVRTIDMEPLKTWSRTQDRYADMGERLALISRARAEDYRGIPQDVLKSMGVDK